MLSKIINSGRNFASLISGRFGNNAIATLNDVNQVVDDINFINNFKDVRILFTQTGTNDPLLRRITSGTSSVKCSGNCNAAGTDCCEGTDKKDLENGYSALRTAIGVYTFRITALDKDSYPEGLLGATFIIGASSTLGNRVTVTFNPLITEPNILEYTIRTYNAAGALADDRLSNTLIAVSVYPRIRSANLSLTPRF